jgi:hypothetical protein
MRRPQRQTLRRRDASGLNARWLLRWWETVRVHTTVARSPRGLAALAVLAGILVLFAGSGAGWASRQISTATHPNPALRAAVGRSRVAPALPATGLWRDTADSTTYSASFQPNADGFSAFDFTTPLGEQIQGSLPLLTLADGSYAQSTGTKPGATTLQAVLTGCDRGILLSDNQVSIYFTFRSHISQDGLGAYATFSYINVQDQTDFPVLCLKGSPQGSGVTTYQLQAGCTVDSCQDLTSLAGPTVDQYDAAVLAAEQNGSSNPASWDAVFNMTSQQITAQYPLQEFASYFNQQVASVGKITQISEPLSPPVPEYTPEGQAYFEIQQTVTVVQHGRSSSRTLISYYLLENGAWRFWFSD